MTSFLFLAFAMGKQLTKYAIVLPVPVGASTQRIGFDSGNSPVNVFAISAIILFCDERLVKLGSWVFAASNEERICFFIVGLSIKYI
jgi:hypothetical protein